MNGTSYMLLAQKGDKGDTGETGATGAVGPVGPTGASGINGTNGTNGSDGVGIQSIQKTAGDSSPGATDTYTITLTNGTAFTFTVYNGANGTSFVIFGRYDTLAELKASHPAGNKGEAWAVGSAAENDVYLWDVDKRMWTNIGSMQGPPGPQGPAGADGAQGVQGPPGKDGQDGAPGPAGTDGADGKSAYQIAVENGFSGTETEWLSSLKGADGRQGIQGPPGTNGETGADGKSAYQYAVDGGYTGTEADFQALLATGIDSKVSKTGDTMSGTLTVPRLTICGDSSVAIPATLKPYMTRASDNSVESVYFSIPGGILGETIGLVVPKTPTNVLEATSKSYVDSKVSTGWVMYNANGALDDDGGPVRKRFTKIVDHYPYGMPQCKSIVRAGRVTTMGAHGPIASHHSLWVVNENHERVRQGGGELPAGKIVVDHYFTRSLAEWREKMARGSCDPNYSRDFGWFWRMNPEMTEKERS